MTWWKRLISIKGAGGLLAILAAIWLFHNWWTARKVNEARSEQKKPHQDSAQEEPRLPVDPGTAQPHFVFNDGANGVDYTPKKLVPADQPSQPISIPDATPQQEVEEIPPMVLCDFAPPPKPTPTPAPKVPKAKRVERWLPRGTYIRCETQGNLSSSHMDTPVQVKITEDVYQTDYRRSELIIPAGARANCFAAQGYTRDCIEVKGEWVLVFPDDGTELEFSAILCNQEYDPQLNQFGKFDKTAGLKGKLIESDSYVRLKAALGLVMKTVSDSASSFAASAAQTAFHGGTSISYNVPSVSPFTDELISQVINGHHTALNDTLYVWVGSGHQAWLYTTSVIDPSKASIGASIQEEEKARKEKEEQQERNQNPLDTASLKRLLQSSNPQSQPEQTTNDPVSNETKPVSAAHFN